MKLPSLYDIKLPFIKNLFANLDKCKNKSRCTCTTLAYNIKRHKIYFTFYYYKKLQPNCDIVFDITNSMRIYFTCRVEF